jgi:hypothetical protein
MHAREVIYWLGGQIEGNGNDPFDFQVAAHIGRIFTQLERWANGRKRWELESNTYGSEVLRELETTVKVLAARSGVLARTELQTGMSCMREPSHLASPAGARPAALDPQST